MTALLDALAHCFRGIFRGLLSGRDASSKQLAHSKPRYVRARNGGREEFTKLSKNAKAIVEGLSSDTRESEMDLKYASRKGQTSGLLREHKVLDLDHRTGSRGMQVQIPHIAASQSGSTGESPPMLKELTLLLPRDRTSMQVIRDSGK
jgi:hypothetical protein